MTLILTQINKFGIIHASDSNLTTNGGSQAGQAQKTFPIGFLKSALTLAGCYSVGGINMDKWMTAFIQDQERKQVASLMDFAYALKQQIEKEMLPEEKAIGSMLHMSGYVEKNGEFHPEFWFLRNIHAIDDTTGEYNDIDDRFELTEDFWSRDCPKTNMMVTFENGGYQFYINGFTSGRIGFVVLQPIMNDFFNSVWSHPSWQFRPPKSIEETEALIKIYMEIINTLFLLSDYSAPLIGGAIQTHVICRPSNTVTTC